MKTRSFILHKLITSKVKLTAEVLRELGELGNGEGAAMAPPMPGEFVRPKRPKPVTSDTKSRCDSKRLVFVSLLPGRWVRCTGAAVAGVCLLLAGVTFGADQRNVFDAANAAFAQGRFTEAARGFESVLTREGYSAPVLYNFANAQFRDGKIGTSILHYERALALAPNNPDITTNLKLARTRAGIALDKPSWIWRFTHSLSLNGWATLTAGAVLIGSVAVLLRRGLPRIRASLGIVASIATLTLMTASSALMHRLPDLDRTIVTAKDCVVRVSPVTTGEIMFSVAEGDAVTVKTIRGDFALIESRDGRSGWVKRGEIESVLVPRRLAGNRQTTPDPSRPGPH